MIFEIFSPKKSAKKLAFLTQNKAKLCKILIITLVFEKNSIFSPKIVKKIAENCDRNIDHRILEFCSVFWLNLWQTYFQLVKKGILFKMRS
jgi:hypothetical protein